MAKNYKTENGKRLKAIRSAYDGRVVGWVDMEPAKKEQIDKIDAAIHKHRVLAAWGNLDSKERLKVLRAHKKELLSKS